MTVNFKRLAAVALTACGALAATVAAVNAQALPGGSYERSCSNCRVEGDYLKCGSCRKGGNTGFPFYSPTYKHNAYVRISTCRSREFCNRGGNLECQRRNNC